ncbi:MAG: heavy metal-associated domain-containing protein [Candidatus Kaiserbacteria bacterium]|nr:heavy metal-associated domain-containing protein [Candidatus Kaiserbacteria bacterium]
MENKTLQTHTFHIRGMHCNSCVLLTENELQNVAYVSRATSNIKTHTVEVCGDFGGRTPEEIARKLTQVLEKHGYTLSVDKLQHKKNRHLW